MENSTAYLMAGIPVTNAAVYHQIRFIVHDPVALIEVPHERGRKRILILRDIEMDRARQRTTVDRVACPADFMPAQGLSGDREIATAQAAAECLRRHQVTQVVGDRSLSLLYVDALRAAGIHVECDRDLGVLSRRSKDEQEIAWIREAQQTTEQAMHMACTMVARATADADGSLHVDDQPLTAERVRAAIVHFLVDHGYAGPPAIVASGPQGADCHCLGTGPIRTGEPVIIDIFPQCEATRYNGDCTRTVVHGDIRDEIVHMHATVLAAKAAAEGVTRAGVTGEEVHRAAAQVIQRQGYHMGLPTKDDDFTYCAMTHGTGHGLGLEVHEAPLLDNSGPMLVAGDILTIEPGLYRRDLGGLRVEDMVVVREDGCENLNQLPTDLRW